MSWEDIGDWATAKYPQVMAVIDLILSLPGSSAVCEQGFSEMKKVKSDWRATLGNDSLLDQMRIVVESPSIQTFDPLPSLNLWIRGGLRRRRPCVATYRKRAVNVDVSSDEWSSSSPDSDHLSDQSDHESVVLESESDLHHDDIETVVIES